MLSVEALDSNMANVLEGVSRGHGGCGGALFGGVLVGFGHGA